MPSFSKKALTDGLAWNFMLFFGSFLYGSHVVLLNICKVNGKIPFNSAAVVFFIELAKLLLSILMLLLEFGRDKKPVLMLPSPKQFMMFSVPAILYTVNNNLVVHVQAYVDPASFQGGGPYLLLEKANDECTTLTNLNLLMKPLIPQHKVKEMSIFRFKDEICDLKQRPISTNKWIAFILITIAGSSNSYGGWVSSQTSSLHHSEMKVYVTLTGIILILVQCCISGTAGVYTEYILKKQAKLPFAVQSIMLYIFGVGMNFFAFFLSQLWKVSDEGLDFKGGGDLFEGFSIWTGVIIGTQALCGIINGAIMKQASSLTRIIMIAGAMLVSTTLSVLIFRLHFNAYFITAFILVIFAMVFYHRPER